MRRGLTLIELLIAMALTLLLVFAMAEFYTYVGDTVRDGRAIIEMGGEIRGTVQQLRDDLQSLTVKGKPPVSDDSGFLELVEGIAHDMDADGDMVIDTNQTMQGDIDDLLSFTIRASGQPFTGRFQFYNQQSDTFTEREIESHLAEVVWFTTFKDTNEDGDWDAFEEPRFLVRRAFLVAPNVPGWSDQNGNIHTGEIVDSSGAAPDNIFQHDDLSLAAPVFNANLNKWIWKANSLGTLTRRENRFIHLDLDLSNGSQNGLRAADGVQPIPFFPNPLQLAVGNLTSLRVHALQNDKHGEDLALPNLLAFDVRVYDPEAPLYADSDNLAALQPGDPGFPAAYGLPMAQPIGWGAYVDLNYNRYPSAPILNSPFAGRPLLNHRDAMNPYDLTVSHFIYDSWSTSYERDGFDQFGDGRSDEAFDGLDSDGQNGVDDAGEFETTPPYQAHPRGVQVRVRMYEPGTRQTRQATVAGSLVE